MESVFSLAELGWSLEVSFPSPFSISHTCSLSSSIPHPCRFFCALEVGPPLLGLALIAEYVTCHQHQLQEIVHLVVMQFQLTGVLVCVCGDRNFDLP